MSKVEHLEIAPAFWKVQIGSKVQDLESYPLVWFPQPNFCQKPGIPSQNLTPASVSSVPAQIFVPVPSQHHIPVPAQIFIPSSVAITQHPSVYSVASSQTCQTQTLPQIPIPDTAISRSYLDNYQEFDV